ncbi:hypothetical protein SBOR_8375 [Sclerotinia borealis F-4128]|uniref:2EXR domain-containing protein n=1 Tax=Sclerotinia borealis (strain F-4128) TaxID=1432307 RepID=W9C8P3_SCLBF|nr:hypothetical protein SBOR_8375 [Sclerotinia borealis F-4128]
MTKFFNHEHIASSKQNHSLKFHLFPCLPREIRLHIWSLSLSQHRFIPIWVSSTTDDSNPDQNNRSRLYSSYNYLGNIISGSHYELSINDSVSNTVSPFLSTTIESRSAALDFFHICLPIARGQVRISPEYDVLFLQSWDKDPSLLANILHDIRAYDPKDEGLLHLALAHAEKSTFFNVPQPSNLLSGHTALLVDEDFDAFLHHETNDEVPYDPPVDKGEQDVQAVSPQVTDNAMIDDNETGAFHDETLSFLTRQSRERSDNFPSSVSKKKDDIHSIATASLVDILSNKLRSLWCVEQPIRKTRNSYRHHRTAHHRPMSPLTKTCPTMPSLDRIDRSYIKFDWLENDPRPVKLDLKQLRFKKDPRRFYHSWRVLEKTLGVQHTVPFQIYVCVATQMSPLEESELEKNVARYTSTNPAVRQIVNRHHQADLAESEIGPELPVRDFGSHLQVSGPGCLRNDESYTQLEKDATTTIGMWIFPGEAFGIVDENNVSEVYERVNVRANVSDLPGLAVLDI